MRFEAAKFADHWHAKAGRDATKADWLATWRNWCRNAVAAPRGPTQRRGSPQAIDTEERNRQAMALLGFLPSEVSDENVIEG